MSGLLDDANKEETNLLTVSLKITSSFRPTNKLQIQEKKRKQIVCAPYADMKLFSMF